MADQAQAKDKDAKTTGKRARAKKVKVRPGRKAARRKKY